MIDHSSGLALWWPKHSSKRSWNLKERSLNTSIGIESVCIIVQVWGLTRGLVLHKKLSA